MLLRPMCRSSTRSSGAPELKPATLGKYRVDFYAGDQVATSINFTIKAGASEKDSDDDDDDDDEKADD